MTELWSSEPNIIGSGKPVKISLAPVNNWFQELYDFIGVRFPMHTSSVLS
jgi:hypothetical protein